VPQRWLNFAPDASDAAHAEQFTAAWVAPQLEQNLPVAWAPHEGQAVVSSAESGGRI
jgi:hypothetical protein